MKRRKFLSACGVTTAAFASLVVVSRESGPAKRVSLVSTDDSPAKYDLSLSAEVVRKTITSSHTAKLRITITNKSDQELKMSDGSRQVFSQTASVDAEPGIRLFEQGAEPISVPGSWRPLNEQARSMELEFTRVPPKERKSIDLKVWGEPGISVDHGISTGMFRFSTTYHVFENGNEEQFDWGFTLSIEKIES